jgi:hypothetical protein
MYKAILRTTFLSSILLFSVAERAIAQAPLLLLGRGAVAAGAAEGAAAGALARGAAGAAARGAAGQGAARAGMSRPFGEGVARGAGQAVGRALIEGGMRSGPNYAPQYYPSARPAYYNPPQYYSPQRQYGTPSVCRVVLRRQFAGRFYTGSQVVGVYPTGYGTRVVRRHNFVTRWRTYPVRMCG